MTDNSNEFARHNLSILTPSIIETLKTGDYRQTPAPIMKCVKCGGWGISTGIMKYFNWNGALFECYKCQRQTKSFSWLNKQEKANVIN